MLFLLALLACSNTEQPSGKDVVLTEQKHAVPAANDYETKSFTCCDSEIANQFLAKYLDLTRAMAADNDQKTKLAVEELVIFANTPEFQALAESDGLKEWISGPKYWVTLNRKDIQQDFEPASQLMVDFAKKHKSAAGTKVITAFCPMAPGRWIQTEDTISNPYYGSMMLTCGVFE